MANFLEFRNDTMDSKLRANTRSPIFPSLSFFVAYTNVARSWHVVLLHVHRLRIIGGSLIALIVASCCPGILSERVGGSN